MKELIMYIRTVGKYLLDLTSIDLYLFDTVDTGYINNSDKGVGIIDKSSGKYYRVGRIG